MPGFDNNVMNAQRSDVGVFPNTTSSDNSTEFDRSGSAVTSITNNTSDTASSDATSAVQVGGTSGGNPQNKWIIPTGQTYTAGVDNANNDRWELATQDGVGANAAITSTPDGEITFPQTPAFLATGNMAQNNVTGAATAYTVNFQNEIFDQNGDYDGTTTFTAPITGRYRFTAAVLLQNLDASALVVGPNVVTSNRSYRDIEFNGANARVNTSDEVVVGTNCLADMDAGDTAFFNITINGMAGDTVDIPGTTPGRVYFCGELSC